MTQRTTLGKRLGVAFAAFAFAWLFAELWLRWVRPLKFMEISTIDAGDRGGWYGMIHRRSSTPGVAYELVPGLDQESMGVRVRTNSLGMRDDEPLARDTPGLFRIVALGDSVTFGYRVTQDATFCAQLESGFAATPIDARRIEVLDTGVSGYSTRDEAAALDGKWLALAPDLVLLCYCINDPECEPRQPLPRFFVAPHAWQHSSVLRFLVQMVEGRRVKRLGDGNYFRYLHATSEPAWKSVESAFERISSAARAANFRVVLAIFPMFSPDAWANYPFRDVHAQVAREGERRGFAVLDLLPRFEREVPTSLLVAPADSHPNAQGHAIAAQELQRFIAEHWAELAGPR